MAPMKRPGSPHPYLAGTLSLDQLARRWRMSRKKIRRMLSGQRLGFVVIEDRLRVPLEEVERYETARQDLCPTRRPDTTATDGARPNEQTLPRGHP
ncbi:MAG: helix-turn-helix domain-containing protein [Pirellulales bacterium]|nr:helix-turn-helix domain-containing protein [Pirellulales bacterium]